MAMIQAKTTCGIVQGVRGNSQGFTVFRGIPFSAPPVGELRFAPPQPPVPWAGVRLCDRWPRTCIQAEGSFGLFTREFYPAPKEMDEDCLYLNIWTPASEPGEKLPVFFWIHGGGFGGGFSYEQEMDGEAACKRGCVQVTIQYRCNSFGFFAHPELKEKYGHTGNQGILDQIAALRWVKENIEAFGGDPDNITIHGQSAGAMSVRILMTSPLCRGLMNRAIIQSGGCINEWSDFDTEAGQAAFGEKLLQKAGLSMDEAMKLPAKELYTRLNAALEMRGPAIIFRPCIDGYVMEKLPGAAICAGETNTDSIMAGFVAGDAGLQAMRSGVDHEERAACFGSVIALGRQRILAGKSPIYGYYFDRNLPGDDNGAWHTCELWYIFGTMHRCWRPWTPYDYELSDALADYWSAFAHTGDPNVPGRPYWAPYTKETPELMHISDGGYRSDDMTPLTEADEKVIEFLGRA